MTMVFFYWHVEVYQIAMGKFPHILFYYSLQFFSQFFTPTINYTTSRKPDGRTAGSAPHMTLFVQNLTKLMCLLMWTVAPDPKTCLTAVCIIDLLWNSCWLFFFSPHHPLKTSLTICPMPALSTPLNSDLHDELDSYLSTVMPLIILRLNQAYKFVCSEFKFNIRILLRVCLNIKSQCSRGNQVDSRPVKNKLK